MQKNKIQKNTQNVYRKNSKKGNKKLTLDCWEKCTKRCKGGKHGGRVFHPWFRHVNCPVFRLWGFRVKLCTIVAGFQFIRKTKFSNNAIVSSFRFTHQVTSVFNCIRMLGKNLSNREVSLSRDSFIYSEESLSFVPHV